MSEPIADITVAPAATEIKETPVPPEPSQDPLKKELDKVQDQKKRTKKDKLLYTFKRVKEQLKEEGVELDDPEVEDDEINEDTPVTVGMLNELNKKEAVKTALELADTLTDATERELVKYHLTETIKPSGNPQDDLGKALALVNSIKNTQLVEEISRKSDPKRFATGAGAPALSEGIFEPTPEEATFMKTMGLTKEDILKARKKEAKV